MLKHTNLEIIRQQCQNNHNGDLLKFGLLEDRRQPEKKFSKLSLQFIVHEIPDDKIPEHLKK